MISAKRFFAHALLLCIAATLSFTAKAQTKTDKATVTDGPEVETKRSSIVDICGTDESGYYTVRIQKGSYYLEHLNKKMVTDKSVKLPKQKVGTLPMYYGYSLMMNGNLYMFTSARDSRENKITEYVQKVDKNSLTPDNKPKEVGSITYPSRRKMMRMMYYNNFLYNRAPREGYLLVYRPDLEPDDQGNLPTSIKFHLEVFNSEMQSQWTKDVNLPYSPDVFSVEQVKVDDDGDVYIIGIEYQEKNVERYSRRSGAPTYIYHIYKYSDHGDNVLEAPVDLKGKFITDMQVDGAPNGDIIVSGFYSEKGSFSIKGAFYMSLDGKTQQVKVQNTSEFETEFITQYYTEREKKKEKKKEAKGEEPELYQFQLNELLVRQDGGATLIAEQYYSNTVCYTTTDAQGHMTTHCDTYYSYNDILVLSFNPDGSLVWKTKIPKRQTTVNDGGYYSSYAIATVDDKLYFIFNDNPKNLFLKPNETPYAFTGSKELAVVLCEVSPDGKVSRELLMTTERGDIIVRPKMCEQTDSREMIILAERAKVYQFSKVIFQ